MTGCGRKRPFKLAAICLSRTPMRRLIRSLLRPLHWVKGESAALTISANLGNTFYRAKST